MLKKQEIFICAIMYISKRVVMSNSMQKFKGRWLESVEKIKYKV